MPELPEVETISRQLGKVLVGQRVKRIKVWRKKSFGGKTAEAEGRQIIGVGRKAKMLIVKLDAGWGLLVHLKMTGQLVYIEEEKRVVGGHPTADWIKELPSQHTRVVLELSKGRLFFNDMRVFGWIKVMGKRELEEQLSRLPPDVVDKEFTAKELENLLARSSRAVKLVLMDQTKVGGVGNIYANDALFCAGVRPSRAGNKVKKGEIRRLYRCLRQVVEKGIRYGGATASDDKFVNASGWGGKYQKHFLVYEREGEKCLRCGGRIKKVKLGGRGTYYCPGCQK